MSLRLISRNLPRIASLPTSVRTIAAPRFLLFRPVISPEPRRFNSTSTTTPATSETPEKEAPPPPPPPPPSYQLQFTCRPCQTRSSHTISKQAYHHGSVLIQCPGCKNRHVITDHLKIFSETAKTLEEILEEKGEVLKRGRLLPGGDVELLPEVSEGEEKA